MTQPFRWIRTLPPWLIAAAGCCALLAVFAVVNNWQRPLREGAAPAEPMAAGPQVAAHDEVELEGGGGTTVTEKSPLQFEVLNTPEFMTTPAIPVLAMEEIKVDLPSFQCEPARAPNLPPAREKEFWDLPRAPKGPVRSMTNYGSNLTEKAVSAGLQWLAEHQQPDGGWSFDQRVAACDETCTHPGQLKECRTAATSLALLAYFGAGQTHKGGKWKKNVESGLYFLAQQMKVTERDGVKCGDLSQGGEQIHAHAISTLVLSEAYSMTHDKGLQLPAKLALNQLLHEPAELDNGWRWLAIRSGRLAGLIDATEEVSQGNLFLAGAMQLQPTSAAQERRQIQIAVVGLYSQMLAGWRPKEMFVERGAYTLGNFNANGDLEFAYFNTLVQRNNDAPTFQNWHEKLKNRLLNSQDKNDHNRGSWHFANDDQAPAGGRLYCTAMAICALEVYYRHCPVYSAMPPLVAQQGF